MSLNLLKQMTSDSLQLLRQDLAAFADVLDTLPRRKLRLALGDKRSKRLLAHWDAFGDQRPEMSLYGDAGPAITPVRHEPERLPWRPGRRILAVGDTHTKPGQNLDRFTALGRAARELLREGDLLVLIGDHYCLDSLARQASPKSKLGLYLTEEKEAGDLARERIDREIVGRGINCVVTEGNHEGPRIERYLSDKPAADGIFDVWAGWEDAGWTVVPYLQPYRVWGIRFQHCFTNGAGRAVSSTGGNARAVQERVIKYDESVVFGHSHVFSFWQYRRSSGQRITSLDLGWFGVHEGYATEDDHARWWNGFHLLDNVKDGDYDLTSFRAETIMDRWS